MVFRWFSYTYKNLALPRGTNLGGAVASLVGSADAVTAFTTAGGTGGPNSRGWDFSMNIWWFGILSAWRWCLEYNQIFMNI